MSILWNQISCLNALDAVGSTGAELARYGERHTSLRQGRDRAEHHSGEQGTESRALRSAGVDSHDGAGRSLSPSKEQPQQANRRNDQHNDDAPRG
jgi:hypothetical protein